MAIDGDYQPSPWDWVADQVRTYEESGGTEGLLHEGKPVVIVSTRGRKTGQVRKTPLMRVEHDGSYAVVASMGGAPQHPVWYLNLVQDPEVTVQDGPDVLHARARVATPEEKKEWWPRATAVWPQYDEYQASTDRDIPVVILEPTA